MILFEDTQNLLRGLVEGPRPGTVGPRGFFWGWGMQWEAESGEKAKA